jgi:hypothetical protein
VSATRILLLYRGVFVALLTLASLQTLALGAAGHGHAVPLAGVELAGALALLWRPTELLGGTLLLMAFAAAQVLAAGVGLWPTQFLQYAASTLLILLLGRSAQSGSRH